ncbi:hypothetical protein EB796_007994 [Bugula neritina]|uniref:Uncharacterized protein n=1 Tax=Bugula neritina TaxID=10212 RepID=A0A7J7K4X3_BUGNE|nr:hypothetical protein EB796_007994 [Bugula neritina]
MIGLKSIIILLWLGCRRANRTDTQGTRTRIGANSYTVIGVQQLLLKQQSLASTEPSSLISVEITEQSAESFSKIRQSETEK